MAEGKMYTLHEATITKDARTVGKQIGEPAVLAVLLERMLVLFKARPELQVLVCDEAGKITHEGWAAGQMEVR